MTTTLGARLGALLCATLLVAGCGAADSDDTATDPQESTSMTPEPETQPEPDPVPGANQPTTRQAVADLVRSQGVAEADVSVVSVEAVTWRDGSLGCAEPGMMYTQALVEGSRVVLEAGGERFEYHAGGSQAPFLCESPTE